MLGAIGAVGVVVLGAGPALAGEPGTPAADVGPPPAAPRLVGDEDDRLLRILADPAPAGSTAYDVPAGSNGVPTTVLTGRERPYDLDALERLGAAERTPDGSWLLTSAVVVTDGAELRLTEPGGTLRMLSEPGRFTSLVALRGRVVVAGAPGAPMRVTSWDGTRAAADRASTDGRAYVRSLGAPMDVVDADVADLGFWSGRTGGLSWTGGSGDPATGLARDITVRGNEWGVFTSRADGLRIERADLSGNQIDGLLVHRDTTRLVADRVTATRNAGDGIVAGRGSTDVVLTGVTASGNAGYGVRIDAGTEEPGPSAGGGSEPGGGHRVEGAVLSGNGRAGLLAVSARDLTVAGSTIDGSPDGLLLRGPGGRATITGNTVSAGEFGIAVRDGADGVTLTGNVVGPARVGVQVADAVAGVRDNRVVGAGHYALSVVGRAAGTVVTGNVLAGSGPAALDLYRLPPGQSVTLGGNDESGWQVRQDLITYWTGYARTHPLIFLWLAILVVPVLIRFRTRRRRAAPGEHPYRNVAPGPEPAPGGDAAPRPSTGEETELMAVTRVTVVSGRGARR